MGWLASCVTGAEPETEVLQRPVRDDAPAPTLRGHTLDVTGLTVRYGGFTALDAVDLRIEPGEVLALLEA